MARHRLATMWSLAAYLGGALLMFRVSWASPTTTVIGGGGDAGLFIWFQRWTSFAVTNGLNPFVTDYLNYPHGVNAMWNTSTPLLGLLSEPIAATFGPVVAYNAVMTACVVASAATARQLLLRWVHHPLAATSGGLVYGFSPFMVAQSLGHTHMTAAFLVPLIVLCVNEILVCQRGSPARWGAALGALSAAQLLIGEELLALTALGIVVLVCALVLLNRRKVTARLPYVAHAAAVALGVFLALAAWPLANQFFGPQRWHGVVQPKNFFVTDLLNLVIPTWATQLSPRSLEEVTGRFTGNTVESTGYLGLPLMGLMAFTAARRWTSPLVRTTTIVGVGIVVLSFGPRLHIGGTITSIPLPWALVDRLPLMANMLPGRFMVLAYLAAAVLVAVAVDDALAARRWRRWVPGTLVLASLVSLVPTANHLTGSYVHVRFFDSEAVRVLPAGEPALVVPIVLHTGADNGMLWQVQSGYRFKMVGGYFIGPNEMGGPRFGPPPSDTVRTITAVQSGQPVELTDTLRKRMRAELRSWGVSSIVVAPTTMDRDAMLRVVKWLTRLQPRRVADVDVWTKLTWEANETNEES